MTKLTLLERLEQLYPDSSKTTLRSWIKWGRITVDGKVVRQSHTEVTSDEIIALKAKPDKRLPGGVRILYHDSHLVAIDKPSGLLSVATDTEPFCAHKVLKNHFKRRVFVVHRLDQATSGVMLFALSDKGYKGLKALFKEHDIEREYVGIVEGQVEEESGTFDQLLYEDKNYQMHVGKGERAITHWSVIKRSKGWTKLRFKLETGKKHQIRVGTSTLGHPITGDERYGAKKDPLGRLALHAEWLSFVHPITKKQMSFSSEVPRSFS